MIDSLSSQSPISHLTSLGGLCCTQLCIFPWVWVNQSIESQLPLHLPSSLYLPDQPSPCTAPISSGHSLQVHRLSPSHMASLWLSEFTWSGPRSISPNLFYRCLHVCTIIVSQLISILAWLQPPSASLSSLNLSLQLHPKTHMIKASKYVSNLTKPLPLCASLRWLNRHLQVLFRSWLCTISS